MAAYPSAALRRRTGADAAAVAQRTTEPLANRRLAATYAPVPGPPPTKPGTAGPRTSPQTSRPAASSPLNLLAPHLSEHMYAHAQAASRLTYQGDGSALARASVQVLLEAAEAARRPVQPQIVLARPVNGAPVGTSVEVRGWISTVPFEKNLTYRVYTDGGVMIGRGWIMVEGDLGAQGTFAKSISLASTHAAGPVRIEVRDVNEADGSLFTSTTVQVFFTGGDAPGSGSATRS